MLKESFIAPTPNEAYKLAVRKYGSIDNFKVVKASQYKDKSGELISEITIEIEEEIFKKYAGVDEEEVLLEEINILKSKMDRMKEVLQPKSKENNLISEVKDLLIKKGLNKNWVDYMLDPFIGTQVSEDRELLLSFVLEEIEDALVVSKKALEARVNIFVGPTGVGKTTTIAKIAAWSLLKGVKQKSIAIINLDNFRVGAYEQLGFYAKGLGVDYYCASDADEFSKILKSLKNKDLIFVDSAGSSPYDIGKLLNTVEFYKSNTNLEDSNLHLVISSASKYVDLKDIYEHFSFLNIDKLIVTKVDETRNIGNLIAFLLETKLPVSFISMGQKVPDDLKVATKRVILEHFIGEVNAK